MLPLARSILGPTARGIQRTLTRNTHHRRRPTFDEKYSNIILIGGITFCAAVWTYAFTQTGVDLYLSPVGRIKPKEWRNE